MKKILKTLLLLVPCLALSQNVVLTKDNTLILNDVIMPDSVSKLVHEARSLDARTNSKDPIYLVLNSPGGDIMSGLEMIRNLQVLNRPVKTLTIFSASMAFQTVQNLDERLILENGTLMSHKARGQFEGEFPGQFDHRYQFYLKKVLRLDDTAAKRTNGKFTVKAYHNLIENEYWCDDADCVKDGFADRVVKASCDKSLEGTYEKPLFQGLIMGIPVEVNATFDSCPLNTSPLAVDISANGKNLFKSKKMNGKDVLVSDVLSTEDLSAVKLIEIKTKVELIIDQYKNRTVVGY